MPQCSQHSTSFYQSNPLTQRCRYASKMVLPVEVGAVDVGEDLVVQHMAEEAVANVMAET